MMISSVVSEDSSPGSFAEVTFSRESRASLIKISLQLGTGNRVDVPGGRVLNQSPGRTVNGNLASLLIISTASSVFNLDPAANFLSIGRREDNQY